jgi:hypothetical protein
MQHAAILVFTIAVSPMWAQQQPTPNVPLCSQTQMRIYSSVFVQKETGDVLGYEFAIKQNDDSSVDALLYVYEGGSSDDGIPLSGRISGKNLGVQGNWVEHLVEYPSKKETVQTHFVKVDGVLDAASFQGHINIENMESPDSVRLKRVKKLWFCKQ